MGILQVIKLALGVKQVVKEFRREKDEIVEVQTVQEVGGFFAQVVYGLVRHALTGYGLLLVNGGYASQDEMNVAIGAVLALVGFGLSVGRKWLRRRLSS